MKFREIVYFEFACQIRRIWTWLFFVALAVLAFLMTRDGSLAEALHDDFFLNSPFAIAKTTVVGSLIWLLTVAMVAGDAAARDVSTGMYPLVYTLPISKLQYLSGRFCAAFLLNALILLAVQAGILLGVYLPGVDTALIGPFRPAAYLTAYGYIALPNALAATALQFALAARSGRPMASYLGSLLLFFMSYVVSLFLLFQGRQDLSNLLDPIGVHFILSELSHLWTPTEKNWRLVGLEGTVLTNRLIWLSFAVTTLLLTYITFQFSQRNQSGRWWRIAQLFTFSRGKAKATPDEMITGITLSVPQVSTTFGFATYVRQTFAIAWDSFRIIVTSWAGRALLGVIPLMTIPVILDQMESNGVPLVPATIRVIGELTAPLSAEMSRWVIVPLLIVFFAGELVWRERDAGLGEITGAMPGSDGAFVMGKFSGLSLVLAAFTALQMVAGLIAQLTLGYYTFEIGLYFQILFGLQLPEYLLFAMLAIAIHILVNQKYIGHLAAIAAYVSIIIAPVFGIEHSLFTYGASPGWSYTQMRGFGSSLMPWLWFKLYWSAWAVLLAVVAKLLWVRTHEGGFRVRLHEARSRFRGPTVWTTGVAFVLILTLGGFIFYNTNILNEYFTASEVTELRADYERRYGKYAAAPQPKLVRTSLHIEIYPERREADIRGTYWLVNRNSEAVEAIHVATTPGLDNQSVTFDRPTARAHIDKTLGYGIYPLKHPLLPGDSLRLTFRVEIKPHGFRENGIDESIVANGTYFTNKDWLPAIGYQRGRELTGAAERRKYGLTARPLIPSLYNEGTRLDRTGGGAFEAIIGTTANQTGVAPGALRRTWTARGRRYYYYATDVPIGDEWAFFSASYAVRQVRWNNVSIRIFHDPRHPRNLNRMIESIRASLDYYTRQFGPYRYGHLTVVERPGNGTGLHAEASMLTYTEGVSLWNPGNDSRDLDLPFAVTAHEMAHQWTVPYAFVEGAPVMSESVAWYYGMKAVENARGIDQLQRLLNFMRQPYPYPPIRRGEPLLRGLDPYLSYRKGPFALYALSEYVGDRQVNKALRQLLEKHLPENAPLATTLDLYRELGAVTPDSLRYLLHDFFEVNTYWELKTDKVTTTQTQNGTWQVKLDIRARKIVNDSTGAETVVLLNDWVDVGVFASARKDELSDRQLYLKKHRIRTGLQTIMVTVSQKPSRAGVDPNYLLTDLKTDDNVREIRY